MKSFKKDLDDLDAVLKLDHYLKKIRTVVAGMSPDADISRYVNLFDKI